MGGDARSRLPGIPSLLERDDVASACARHGRGRVLAHLRGALDDARARVADGLPAPDADRIVADALGGLACEQRRRLRTVINATGVVLHTNLGRAPLADEAVRAMVEAAGASNLELDLDDGRRGGRGRVAGAALARLCGAQAAVVVNNAAGALVLALSVLAGGRTVVVSRGELVEIGGAFRLPEIVAAAGVGLHEVGTTNRTHLRDYQRALSGAGPAAVLRVHPSSYRVEGFTARPSTVELAACCAEAGVPLVHDVGSGLLAAEPALADEPVVADEVAAGADLVVCSADKLLGGPQAGVLAGRADLVARCAEAPLARALRVDKLRLAALEATADLHERGAADRLPVTAQLRAEPAQLMRRAEALAASCDGWAQATEAVVGGGAAPQVVLASAGVVLDGPAEALAAALRGGEPPVVGRIDHDRVVLDLRTVDPGDDQRLAAAVRKAREAG